jgi:hypothetical protein
VKDTMTAHRLLFRVAESTRKMWTQIAGEQAQLQAIDQNPPGWTAGKKRTLNRISRLREKRPGSRELLGPGWQRYPSCATKPLSPPLWLLVLDGPLDPFEFYRQPTFRNPLCWLNVGHQMIADQHDRALKVIFSRIRKN